MERPTQAYCDADYGAGEDRNRYLATSFSLLTQPLVGMQRSNQQLLNQKMKENMPQWHMQQRN